MRVRKDILIIGSLILFFGLGTLIPKFFADESPLPSSSTQQSNDKTVGTPPTIAIKDEYEVTKKELFILLHNQNPRVALEELERLVPHSEVLTKSCHALVHELGRESFKKYQDFSEALKYTNETCNTGYMHGVIEEYFSNSVDIEADMKTVCSNQDFGRCYHAVGHGAMYYSGNNLPESISLCKTYPETTAQNYCSQGAYMENFNTDRKLHPSKFLDSNDPFYPCAEQESRFKAVCYFYAPTFYLNVHDFDYAAALAWCETAEKGQEYSCVRGVGSLAIKFNITNPTYIEEVCQKASTKYIPHCIDGMVGLYINHYDSLDKGKELCIILQEANKATCEKSVASRSYLFQQ